MLTVSTNVAAIAGLVAAAVPLVTNIVTHRLASSRVKAAVMVALAVVGALAVYLTHLHGAVRWQGIVFYALESLVVAGAAYSHAYKPAGVIDLLDKLWGSFGIGAPPPAPPAVGEPPVVMPGVDLPPAATPPTSP